MKMIILFLLAAMLTTPQTYASEIKIGIKKNVMNFDNEIFTSVAGEFETNRYVIRPIEERGVYIEVYDGNKNIWESNSSLWNEQVLIENMKKIKFRDKPDEMFRVYFELLDLKTSNKYVSTKIPIFSNKEEINFLNALNQNLKNSD